MNSSNGQTLNKLVNDIEGTRDIATQFSQLILNELERNNSLTICLTGTLGAGKTTFTRCLCTALGVNEDDVSSPTFSLHQRYLGMNKLLIDHFDFYRFDDEDQIFEIGFEETVSQPGLHLVEWGEKFANCLPEGYWTLKIDISGEYHRIFSLEAR